MTSSFREEAFVFGTDGAARVGIVTAPATRASPLGVVVVVGGPQYRVGSHRQFVLLARALAGRGYPVMRFDCAGMGDSTGRELPFTDRDTDIAQAIDAFVARRPELTGVAVWGLCDAASAALLYAHRDARVKHLVLLNPWVRSEAGLARTHLKHYYRDRLFDRAFWAGVLRGRVGVRRAVRGFLMTLVRARGAGRSDDRPATFQARMAEGWRAFDGDILLVRSGDDLTAREFSDHAGRDAAWAGLVEQSRVMCCELTDADHTFSRAAWRDRVAEVTGDWLDTRDGRDPQAAVADDRSGRRSVAA